MVAIGKSNVLSPTNVSGKMFLTELLSVLDQPGNKEQLIFSANASLNSIIYACFAFASIFVCMDCILGDF